jgi:hypothetical protein
MSENIFACKCGFKCVESQLGKSEGFCPKCNEGREDMIAKHSGAKWQKRKVN